MGLHCMRFQGKTILVVSPDFPFPANHGGKLDIWGRVKVLNELGFRIQLLYTSFEEATVDQIKEAMKYVDKVIYCKRMKLLRVFFSFLPYQIQSRSLLRIIDLKNQYFDFMLLENHYVASVLKNQTVQVGHKILRIQNDERHYYFQLAKSERSLLRKIFFISEALKMGLVDNSIIIDSHNLLFISNEEFQKYGAKYPKLNSEFLPPPFNTTDLHEFKNVQKKNVLFLGSLFMSNNKEAIEWYVNNVHPLLSFDSEYQFVIAGNSKGLTMPWLEKILNRYKNIIYFDTPDDLFPIYRNSMVFVNPMHHGAGVKLKTIEAIKYGLPLVTTTKGNEGTGLINNEHVLISNDPLKFSENIRSLLNSSELRKRLVENSQKYLKSHFDQKKILDVFLEKLINGGGTSK